MLFKSKTNMYITYFTICILKNLGVFENYKNRNGAQNWPKTK